jgi:hypothetical protein
MHRRGRRCNESKALILGDRCDGRHRMQSPDSGLPRSELYKIICFVPSGDV